MHAWGLGWGLGWVTSESIIHINLHKLNNELVSAFLEHYWCIDKPHAYTNSQDSPQSKLGGNHHLPPYNIIYDSPHRLHPNDIFPKILKLGSCNS
jgi:hypothetical protein